MFRSATAVAIMLSVSGLPMLCSAGLVTHACDVAESCDSHADESHAEPGHVDDGRCGHESDCSEDPCTVIVTRPDEGPVVPMGGAIELPYAVHPDGDFSGIKFLSVVTRHSSDHARAHVIQFMGAPIPLRV